MNTPVNNTDSFTSNLIFPLIVALVGGVILYWLKLVRERGVIKQALISDINLLLRQAADYREYLSLDGHSWLKEGETLIESPVFVSAQKQVFAAVLPYFWLLSKAELRKVLLFYSHIDACEKLIEILFLRIQKLEGGRQPLTAKQVALIKTRRDRIVGGLESAIKNNDHQINELINLSDRYELKDAKEVAKEIRSEFRGD